MKVASSIIAAALAVATSVAFAQSRELRIAHIYGKTGALEAYAKQTATGFMMGLEYATKGTMTVAGRALRGAGASAVLPFSLAAQA